MSIKKWSIMSQVINSIQAIGWRG